MVRLSRWLIPVLSKKEWAEAMLAEAAHLPQGPARRRWLLSAALSALAATVGRLAGVCVAGALVSYAVWRHPEPEVAYLSMVVMLLSSIAGGFVWLHALRRSTASGVVAAAVAATATNPWGGPFSELGLAGTLTLPLMLAAVAAVIAMTLARMLHRTGDDHRAFMSGIWAAVFMFTAAVAVGAGSGFLPGLSEPAMYGFGLAGGLVIGLAAATAGLVIARPWRARSGSPATGDRASVDWSA